ncbi:hypothetical protein HYE67_002140 [Fusarium culmorum]|uniref:Uncharacterized protein n=1 Tax=Fusarium culmorum TaxID=5516 RepID=A0A7S8D0V6_FUSCU|nr:hypothetical protein HYE67_002140 [Fusarium culmorum]
MSSLPSCSSSDTADVAQDMIASDVDSLITQDDIPVETQAKDQPKVQFLVALNLIGSDRSPPWTMDSIRTAVVPRSIRKVDCSQRYVERIVLNLIKAGLLDIDHVKEVYAGIDEYCSDYEILPPEP